MCFVRCNANFSSSVVSCQGTRGSLPPEDSSPNRPSAASALTTFPLSSNLPRNNEVRFGTN